MIDDTIFDDVETPRNKLKGQILRPYSAVQVIKDVATSTVHRKGRAPEGENLITGGVLVSGKTLHEAKKRSEKVERGDKAERGEKIEMPAVSSEKEHLTLINEFSGSLSSFAKYVQDTATARPSTSPLQSRSMHGMHTSAGRSISPTLDRLPSPSSPSYVHPSAYVPYEKPLTQKLEEEFQYISHPRFRLTSPNRKTGQSMVQRIGMSEQDQHALRLGRLVMSSVFNQPEVTTTDSVSRFFLDNWLAKNGSDFKTADTLSVTLMCGLQKSLAEHKFKSTGKRETTDMKEMKEMKESEINHSNNSSHKENGENNNQGMYDDSKNYASYDTAEGEEKEGDDFSYPTSEAHKIVTAVALETLDRLIVEFGSSNPVLKDIREALLPSIYVSLDPHVEYKEEDDDDDDEGRGVGWGKDGKGTGEKSNEENMNDNNDNNDNNNEEKNNPNDDHNNGESKGDNQDDKVDNNGDNIDNQSVTLKGNTYNHCLTWRDNVEVVAAQLEPTKRSLIKQQNKNKQLKEKAKDLLFENEKLTEKNKYFSDQNLLDENTIKLLNNVKAESELRYDLIFSGFDEYKKQHELERKIKEKEDSDNALLRDSLTEKMMKLEKTLRLIKEDSELKLRNQIAIIDERDHHILELEKRILELEAQVSSMRDRNMAEEERKNVLIAILLKETKHSLKGFQGSAPEPVSGTNAALLELVNNKDNSNSGKEYDRFSLSDFLETQVKGLKDELKAAKAEQRAREASREVLQKLCDQLKRDADMREGSLQAELKSLEKSGEKVKAGLTEQLNALTASLETSRRLEKAASAFAEEADIRIKAMDVEAEGKKAYWTSQLLDANNRYNLLKNQYMMKMEDHLTQHLYEGKKQEYKALDAQILEEKKRIDDLLSIEIALNKKIADLSEENSMKDKKISELEQRILDLDSRHEEMTEKLKEIEEERTVNEGVRAALVLRADNAEHWNEELKMLLEASDSSLSLLRLDHEIACMNYEHQLSSLLRDAATEMRSFQEDMILMSTEFETEQDTELSDANKREIDLGRDLQEGTEGIGGREGKGREGGKREEGGGIGGIGGMVIGEKGEGVGKGGKEVRIEGIIGNEEIRGNEGIEGIEGKDETASPTKGRFTETYPIEDYPIKFKDLKELSRRNSFDPFARLLMRLREKLKQVEDYDCNVLGDGNASVLTLDRVRSYIRALDDYLANEEDKPPADVKRKISFKTIATPRHSVSIAPSSSSSLLRSNSLFPSASLSSTALHSQPSTSTSTPFPSSPPLTPVRPVSTDKSTNTDPELFLESPAKKSGLERADPGLVSGIKGEKGAPGRVAGGRSGSASKGDKVDGKKDSKGENKADSKGDKAVSSGNKTNKNNLNNSSSDTTSKSGSNTGSKAGGNSGSNAGSITGSNAGSNCGSKVGSANSSEKTSSSASNHSSEGGEGGEEDVDEEEKQDALNHLKQLGVGGQFPERRPSSSGTADPMFLKPILTEIKGEKGGKGEKDDWKGGLRAFGRGEYSDRNSGKDKDGETDREKSRREFDSRWKRHRSVTYTEATSMALIAPYIKFIRRNEEVLSRKVAKLSMLLREAKALIEDFEQIIQGVDLTITFDSYGNIADRKQANGRSSFMSNISNRSGAGGTGAGAEVRGSFLGGLGGGLGGPDGGADGTARSAYSAPQGGPGGHGGHMSQSHRPGSPNMQSSRLLSPNSNEYNGNDGYNSNNSYNGNNSNNGNNGNYHNYNENMNDEGDNQYYRVTDDGFAATRYPSDVIPLMIRNRPLSPGGTSYAQDKLNGEDDDEEGDDVGVYGGSYKDNIRANRDTNRDTNRDSQRDSNNNSNKDSSSNKENKGGQSSRSATQSLLSYRENKDKNVFDRLTSRPSYPAPPVHTVRAPKPMIIIPHQTYEYDRAINAIKSIRSRIESHKTWLFDADIGAESLEFDYGHKCHPIDVLAKCLVLPSYNTVLSEKPTGSNSNPMISEKGSERFEWGSEKGLGRLGGSVRSSGKVIGSRDASETGSGRAGDSGLVWCSEKLEESEKGEKGVGLRGSYLSALSTLSEARGEAGGGDEDYYKTQEFRVQDLSEDEGRVVLAEITKVRNALSDNREVSGGWRALLYRTDGTLDLSVNLDSWSDVDKIHILREQVHGLQRQFQKERNRRRQEMDELKRMLKRQRLHDSEIMSVERLLVGREKDRCAAEMRAFTERHDEIAVYHRVKAGILEGSIICDETVYQEEEINALENTIRGAAEYLKKLCRRYKVDPNKLGVSGFGVMGGTRGTEGREAAGGGNKNGNIDMNNINNNNNIKPSQTDNGNNLLYSHSNDHNRPNNELSNPFTNSGDSFQLTPTAPTVTPIPPKHAPIHIPTLNSSLNPTLNPTLNSTLDPTHNKSYEGGGRDQISYSNNTDSVTSTDDVIAGRKGGHGAGGENKGFGGIFGGGNGGGVSGDESIGGVSGFGSRSGGPFESQNGAHNRISGGQIATMPLGEPLTDMDSVCSTPNNLFNMSGKEEGGDDLFLQLQSEISLYTKIDEVDTTLNIQNEDQAGDLGPKNGVLGVIVEHTMPSKVANTGNKSWSDSNMREIWKNTQSQSNLTGQSNRRPQSAIDRASGSEYRNLTLNSRPLSGKGRFGVSARLEPAYLPCLGSTSMLIPKGDRPDSANRGAFSPSGASFGGHLGGTGGLGGPLGGHPMEGVTGVSVPLVLGGNRGRPLSPFAPSFTGRGSSPIGGYGSLGGETGGGGGSVSGGPLPVPSLSAPELFSGSLTPLAPTHLSIPLSPPAFDMRSKPRAHSNLEALTTRLLTACSSVAGRLHEFSRLQFHSKLESALQGYDTKESDFSNKETDLFDKNRKYHTISGDDKTAGCYDRTYRTVSFTHPTETEIANRKIMSDVVEFVRKTNDTIKQHVNEAARLDEQLQGIAENYFPETFNNEDLLSEAIRYCDAEGTMDLIRVRSPLPHGVRAHGDGPRYPLGVGTGVNIPGVNVSGGEGFRRSRSQENENMKSTRFSLPSGDMEHRGTSEGGVNEMGDNTESNGDSGVNYNNNVGFENHINNINDGNINNNDNLSPSNTYNTYNNSHNATRNTNNTNNNNSNLTNFANTFPKNMRPTSAQPALPSASTHFNANIHFSTTANFKSGIDPRSFPFMSGSRSENLIEMPSSLTGSMPPRKFSAQLKKKSFLVEKKGMEMMPHRGLDARARLGS